MIQGKILQDKSIILVLRQGQKWKYGQDKENNENREE